MREPPGFPCLREHTKQKTRNTRTGQERNYGRKQKLYILGPLMAPCHLFWIRGPGFLFCTEPTNYLAGADPKQHLQGLTGARQVHFWEALEDVTWSPEVPGKFQGDVATGFSLRVRWDWGERYPEERNRSGNSGSAWGTAEVWSGWSRGQGTGSLGRGSGQLTGKWAWSVPNSKTWTASD